jgi:hypothetical protein
MTPVDCVGCPVNLTVQSSGSGFETAEVRLDGTPIGFLEREVGEVGIPNCTFVTTTISLPGGIVAGSHDIVIELLSPSTNPDFVFHDVQLVWESCDGDPTCCPVDTSVPVPAPAGDGTVTVDILITDVGPLDEFGFDLDYDETRLEFQDCLRSTFTQACPSPGDPGCFDDLSCFDNPTTGVVRVGGFSASGNETPDPGGEILCSIVFRPIDPSQTSAQVTTMAFSDDLAGISIEDCKGTVTFDPEGTGDVNNDAILSVGDAACAFRCFLSFGDISLFPFSLCDLGGFDIEDIRADVNCDGNCTVTDANCIRDRWGICSGAPSHCFCEDGTACPANFPGGVSGVLREARVAELRVPDTEIARGDLARIPLQVRGTGNLSLFGADFALSGGLEVLGVERATDTSDWDGLDAGLAVPGVVRIGGFGGDAPLSPGEWTDLAYLVVRARAGAADVERISFAAGFENLEHSLFEGGEIQVRSPAGLPSEFDLAVGRPNPSSGAVGIAYSVPSGETRFVEIDVYDVNGRLVRSLVRENREAGRHEVFWNGEDESGRRVASGAYFCRMKAGAFDLTRKLVRSR